jgi:hypothetical protein
LLVCCETPQPSVQEPAGAKREAPAQAPTAAPHVQAPPAARDAAPPPEATPAASAPQVALPSPPARGCALALDQALPFGGERALVVATEGGVLLVAVESDRKKLSVWRGRPGALRAAGELPLEAGVTRATLERLGGEAWLGWVDERGRLFLAKIAAAGFEAPRLLAEGVDRRFAPALAQVADTRLVAFTRTLDETMHTYVARVRGGSVALEDVAPQGHGASAATFVRGFEPPVLVFLDAHAGVSPLLEVRFDEAGAAQPAVVRTPVSQPYAPTLLAAVALNDDDVQVAFTAIGNAAATAVGRVPLRRPEAPVALVPSKGYGELSFSAAQGEGFAVFALEAHEQPSKDAERELRVQWLDARAEGTPLTLGADALSLRAPSMSRGMSAGEFWLSYRRGDALHLARLSCARAP